MKTLFCALLTGLSISSIGQKVSLDMYASQRGHFGIDLLEMKNNGLILGVGGSYMLVNNYNGESNKYEEIANHVLPKNGKDWPLQYRSALYNQFTQTPAVVNALFGYEISPLRTKIIARLGIGFRNQYSLGKGINPGITEVDPETNKFYTYQKVAPQFNYGLSFSTLLIGKLKNWGIMAGYSNGQGWLGGLHYKMQSKTLFNW